MKIEYGKIEKGDCVYAALSFFGKRIAELKMSDAMEIEDVVRKLRMQALSYTGMACVYIRNCTQGWALRMPMLMSRSSQAAVC